MAITPSGYPAWVRGNTHENYGGNVGKTNYLSRGVIDARTDFGAEALCRMAADLEALHRVAPFAVISYTNNDTSPAAPTINSVLLMTGVRSTSYEGGSAPTGFPSAVRNSDGNVTFTFESSYSDAYSISGAWSPKHAVVGSDADASHVAPYVTISGQTVTVAAIDVGETAVLDRTMTLVVW